jgi:UDP-N-acetylglucosamine--N-acetylmuramyl-(pentapeptide) pyrophosphoryl-undecaprenol N-acetylglucosamine transferase
MDTRDSASETSTLEHTFTVLVSGGHITPALATIEYLQQKHPELRIVFVGREYSQVKERQVAKERELSEQLGIKFYAVTAAKFHRTLWWRNGEELLRWFPSLWQAFQILKNEKVDLFLSFGGYLAVPFAIVAKLMGKKVVTHEQTITSGLANEVIAQVADKIAVSFEASRRHFPKHKTVLTGNPLRRSLLREYSRRPGWIPVSKTAILYVTGGSQGSQTINNAVGQILPELTEKFLVVHQCGQSQGQHYLRALQEQAEALPPKQRERYAVREWVDEKDFSWILQHAVLAVSRAGANTMLEISLHAVPTIFIPLPFSHNNEQEKNAMTLVEAGAALMLDQQDLTPDTLLETILTASSQRAQLRRKAEKVRDQQITDGAKRLGELCVTLLRS